MIATNRFRRVGSDGAEINMAPLIDMIFILLIFFLVTTSFVRETGIEVRKPAAATAEALEKESILIGIDGNGKIHMENREVGLLSVRALVKEALRRRDMPVIIIADRETRTRVLVDVIDECKLAGARKISLASEKE